MNRDFSDRAFARLLWGVVGAVVPVAAANSCAPGPAKSVVTPVDASLESDDLPDAAPIPPPKANGIDDEKDALPLCAVGEAPWYRAAPGDIVPDTVAKCETLCGCQSRFGGVVDCIWHDMLSDGGYGFFDADDDAGLSDGGAPDLARGERLLVCKVKHPGGRRPGGLLAASHDGDGEIALYFADLAHLEQASIAAFAIVARDLATHGGPEELIEDAKRAMRDEARHARSMRRLAARYGARPGRVRLRAKRGRSLEEVAIENAVEGCVLETYAAAVAMWQCERAENADVREEMTVIADDESRHAALAWRIDAWAMERLDAAGHARVRRAKIDAVNRLKLQANAPVDRGLAREVGLPNGGEAAALVAALESQLW